jgi:hypothetical protein
MVEYSTALTFGSSLLTPIEWSGLILGQGI